MTGWLQATVKDVAVTYDGPHATPKSTKTATEGAVFLGISSLINGRLDLSQSALIDESEFKAWTRRVTPTEGDVVFSYETRLGEAAIIPSGLRCALGRRLALMRPDRSKVDPRFLLYYYLGPQFQEVVRKNTVQGSTVDRILLRDFPDFPILVPPIREQRGIAATLGALDDKIESNRRAQNLVLDTAQAAYVQACSKGSQLTPLKDVGRWLSGGTPSTTNSNYWGGTLPWVSAASLKTLYIRKSDRNLTPIGADAATNIVPAGTVIFVVRGMSLKSEFRFGLTQREVTFGQDCKAIIPRICPAVLTIALRTSTAAILELVDEAGHGTGRLATDLLEQLPIEIPTDPAFAPVAQSLLARGASAAEENDRLIALRDTLLPELLSGRIRVPESKDDAA
jgi:type I restriction enzyme S subunit